MFGIGGKSFSRRRRSARITFAFLFLLSVILFFAGQGRQDALSEARKAIQDGASPIMTYLTMPVRGFENLFEDWRGRSIAYEENKRLKAELARLRDVEARANALAFKIARFNTILNANTDSSIPDKKTAARAVTEQVGPFVRSALLNVGADKNIEAGNAVMTEDGLLGHIVSVGKHSSRVLRLEDLNSRVSVMSVRSKARAILKGNNSPYPTLSFIAASADWKDGDEVITSGDSGVLPAGLAVGTLKTTEEGDLAVNLYVNKQYIDWVWVYPYNELLPPEEDPLLPNGEEPESKQVSHVNIANEDTR